MKPRKYTFIIKKGIRVRVGFVKFRERKLCLVKYDMSIDDNFVGRHVKTLITPMCEGKAKKNARSSAWLEFMNSTGWKQWVT